MKRAILMALAVGLAAPLGGVRVAAQQDPQPLNFFKNIFVTGNYVVGGVGLRGQGVGGVATGIIEVPDIPTNADVLGAFLYWQTVAATPDVTAATVGVKFNGETIGGVTDADGTIAKQLNPGGTTPCWSAGGAAGSANGSKVLMVFRADVLRFITETRPDGRLAVDVADRLAVVPPLPSGGFEVQMPDGGSGNSLPLTLGASLVVIYRDPSEPLRSIVMYDGGFTLDQGNESFDLTMEGMYQAVGPTARLTAIVGDGQANFSEHVQINGVDVAGYTLMNGPFMGPDWDNVTFYGGTAGAGIDFTMPTLTDSSAVSFSIDREGLSSYDCLSVAATVFSAPVRDTDFDGLLDVWEDADQTELTDPRGVPVPNLNAMGATHTQRDIFFEVGYLTSDPSGTACTNTLTSHCHRPSRTVVDKVAQAYMNGGIMPHFDMGSDAQYYTPPAAWIVPAAYARGGNAIPEEVCSPASETCQFPDVPVIGWKTGFLKLRDEIIDEAAALGFQERFDSNRRDSFRYALFAHALGLARSEAEPNVPAKTSGIADPPGGDLMVTLGLWDDQIGTEFMQASTWLHESGHNGNLRHGGIDPAEANCKPNYQSVMNYLFQTRGVICNAGATVGTAPACVGAGMAGQPVIDLSRQVLPSLNELGITETPGLGTGTVTMAYRTRWYSPVSAIDAAVGTTPPTKRCDGGPIVGDPLYRIDGTSVSTATIDWYADGVPTIGSFPQDVSFSIGPTTLNGSSDWTTIDLRHVGSRRNVAGLSIGVTDADLGKGDLGKGDLGKGDLGKGDLGKGDLGKGDLGKGDLGKGDLGDSPPDSPPGDLNLDTARHVGNAPNQLIPVVASKSITVSWTPPHVDKNAILRYDVFRSIGATVTATNFVQVSPVTGVTGTSFVDTTVKNNTTYTYFVRAVFDGPQIGAVGEVKSGISNFQTILKK